MVKVEKTTRDAILAKLDTIVSKQCGYTRNYLCNQTASNYWNGAYFSKNYDIDNVFKILRYTTL